MFTNDELKEIKNLITNTEINENLKTILEKIDKTLKEVENYDLCLWSFHWDCGRAGDLEGVFKATKDDVKRLVGYDVYFGEVLGKHSEVYGRIEERDIKLLSDDPIEVINAKESGYDPLEFIDDIDYFIDGLTVEQLQKFLDANDFKYDTNNKDELVKLIYEHYDGSESDELRYARNFALKK